MVWLFRLADYKEHDSRSKFCEKNSDKELFWILEGSFKVFW